MIKYLLLFFFLFLTVSCSHQLPQIVVDRYWEQTIFLPSANDSIKGYYECSSGLDGIIIELKDSFQFFYNHWTDLYDPDDSIKGIYGTYHIFADTLFLIYEGHVLFSGNKDKFDKTIQKTVIWLFKRIGNDLYLTQPFMKRSFAELMLHFKSYFVSKNGIKIGISFPLRAAVVKNNS